MNQTVYDKTNEFFELFPRMRFRKGQAVLTTEEEVPYIFWMERGTIRLYQITSDGTEITLHLFHSPSLFPMMFYLSQRNDDYFFKAVEEVVARKAPAKQVVEFLKQNPDVLFDLTSRFADAITGLLLRITQLSSQNAYQRICSLLLYLTQKFGHQEGEKHIIDMKLGHEEIATWVGVVRETVSHQMEKLVKEKIITTEKRRLVVLDIERLKQNVN